jgi:hypothetical protein
VPGPHDQQTRELALCAGRGLEGQTRHSGRFAQRAFQGAEQLERALSQFVVLERVKSRESRK